MSGLLQDLRQALRQLRKSPGFSAAAILTLALGIAASAVVLAVVESVLIAPLPYHDADRIVAVNTRWTSQGRSINRVTGPDFVDLRGQASDLEAIAYYNGGEIGIQLPDHAAFTGVQLVSADFAKVFALAPVAGRVFTDDEADHSAIVNATFARDNFGGVENTVGKTIRMEGRAYDIVGVVPGEFTFPGRSQVWVGQPSQPESMERTAFNYRAVAKLKPDVSLAGAQAQLETIGRRLRSEYPGANKGKDFAAVPLRDQLVGAARPMFLLLLGAVGLILLIACVNVAHLQLARATTRMREVALRTVLGASRWRVVRQVLLESSVLALFGGALGVLMSTPLLRAFLRLAPPDIPRLSEVHVSASALGFTALVCVAAALLSGIAPAWQTLRLNINDSIKQDTSRGLAGRGAARLRGLLVVAEIALTFVLAAGAGLLVRTMIALDAADPGYRSDRLLVMYAHAPARELPEYLARADMFESLFARLRELPGVRHVAGVMGLPSGEYGSNGGYQVQGQPLPAALDDLPQADFSLSSPGYFSTLGIPLLRGRDFAASDAYDAEFVAIISRSLARRSFGHEDPIGQHIRCGLDSDKWMTVVGVAGDVRQASPASAPGPTLYMPLKQHPYHANEIEVVMRTELAPLALMETARKTVRAMDPQIATKFTTMDAVVTGATATPRFRSWLAGGFAVLGLALAMLGIYGVMAYTVSQRTFEVGVRMTFGAKPRDILGLVLAQATRLTAAGVAVGLGLTMVAARLMASMLFGVPADDPVSFGAAGGMLTLAALAAAFFPARRAAAVNPLAAIRHE